MPSDVRNNDGEKGEGEGSRKSAGHAEARTQTSRPHFHEFWIYRHSGADQGSIGQAATALNNFLMQCLRFLLRRNAELRCKQLPCRLILAQRL